MIPQQAGVVIEMAQAIEDGRITQYETQQVMHAALAFGVSVMCSIGLGILVRQLVRSSLFASEQEIVLPVVDVILAGGGGKLGDNGGSQ